MTPEPPPAPPEGAVLVLAAWHLPRMRSMPGAFRHVRRLDRDTRGAPGLLWGHRWVSRRSLLLTTLWADARSAEGWLAGGGFARADAALARIPGARARLERYRASDGWPPGTGAAR